MKATRIFLLVALASLVVSCGSGKKTENAIKVLNWGTETEGKVWVDLAKIFTEKTGIAVDVETAEWSVYWDKINTLYAAGTPPEVFAMDAPLFKDWYSRNALRSLQEYVDKDSSLIGTLYPSALTAYKTDEGYFGLPRDIQTIVLFYNKDMFDAAKIAYPTADWTWDDLRAAAKKLTLKDSDGTFSQWGISPDLWDIEPFMSSLVWSYGGEILSGDFKKTKIAENMEPWKLVRAMIAEDKSIPDAETQAQYGQDLFFAGKAAMIPMGHWAVPQYSTGTFKWDVAPLPKGPAGRASSINSAGFVMAKNCANPSAGWEWIKYVLSKEGQTKLAELGFAIPARMDVAESSSFREQATKIDQQVFLDSIAYAHPKPVFKGYDAWSSAFGDSLSSVYDSSVSIDNVLQSAAAAADKVLSEQ